MSDCAKCGTTGAHRSKALLTDVAGPFGCRDGFNSGAASCASTGKESQNDQRPRGADEHQP